MAPPKPCRDRSSHQHRHRGWNFDKDQEADQGKGMEAQEGVQEGVPEEVTVPGVVEEVSVRTALKAVPRINN